MIKNKSVKHLYIHIPFCNHICSFCDFKRVATNNYEMMQNYVNTVISTLKAQSQLQQYKTIYLGGGTPNHLPDDLLTLLLKNLQPYLAKNYEFTIECNPELVHKSQVGIFKKYGINRISLGVQTTNDEILKAIRRLHTISDAKNAIDLFYKHSINNVSLDFIYNLPNMQLSDLDAAVQFIIDNNIKHVSFYSLEIKENALLNKLKYKLDFNKEEEQMLYLQKAFLKTKLKRYEISNWAINKKHQSQHNLSYWKMHDWKAIGYGAYGLEKKHYYHYLGHINSWEYNEELWDQNTYNQEILMMGLRLVEGLDLKIKKNLQAYLEFKPLIKDQIFIKNNRYLKAKNLDCLDDILLKMI